jgi:hypothetical protein
MLYRVISLLILLFPATAGAVTWHVCPISGEYGTEDGTSEANCFDSFADMAGSYATIAAGDTICYSDATEFTTADAQSSPLYLHYFNDSGSAGNPITLDGDCDADGVNAVINAGGTISRVMQIADNNNLVIKNFELKNGLAVGLLLYNTATDATDRGSILVDSVYIYNIQDGTAPQGIGSRGIGVTIQDSIVDTIGEDGIYHKGTNFKSIRNRILGVSVDNSDGDCLQLNGAYSNYLIEDNYCDHTNVASKQCFIAGGPTDNGNGVIKGSTCLRPANEATNTTYGYYMEAAGGNTVIENNYYYGGRTAYQVLGAGTFDVQSNLAVILDSDLDTRARCISIGSSAGQTDVLNNSCYGGYEGIVSTSSTAASIRNNAVSTVTDDCINKAAGDSESYNKCHAYGGDLVSNNGTATSAGTETELIDPQFLRGVGAEFFKPKRSSPLLGAGYPTSNKYDYNGVRFSNPPSIGAYSNSAFGFRSTYSFRNE